jgi:hypothetical protein
MPAYFPSSARGLIFLPKLVDSGKIEQEIINKCQQLRIMFPEGVAFFVLRGGNAFTT